MKNHLAVAWRDFSGRLWSFIRSRVRDDSTADDIRQEVFLRMQRRLGQLRDLSKLEAWLWQITRNAIADHYRASRDMVELSDDLPASEGADSGEREGLHQALRRMVDDLPETFRDAVRLSELEGLPQKVVAEKLGLSLTGTKSRIRRGRATLKNMLENCCRLELDHRGHVAGCEPRRDTACVECD